jgi:stearoyl-CoA desaturase (delta-9 desaturase)
MVIVAFFLLHWQLSIFCQTFYLHRYSAHKQFTMSPGWERFFHFATWFSQGASYLSPRAYAILHRMHHAYSDTEKDPHSPRFFRDVMAMMWHTKGVYSDIRDRKVQPEARFDGNYPEWPLLDGPLSHWGVTFLWMGAYTLFYVRFATQPWMVALLPVHFLMGPIHGAIVNWCGHKYGYRNFDSEDDSRNTLPFDFLTMGELFQNNHHKFGQAPNFAVRSFEVDPAYQIMRLLQAAGIIAMGEAQTMSLEKGRRSRKDRGLGSADGGSVVGPSASGAGRSSSRSAPTDEAYPTAMNAE